MSARIWTYEEIVDMIAEAEDTRILHIRTEMGKCGIDIIKLPVASHFGISQIVMRTVREDSIYSNNRSEWILVGSIREIHDVLVRQFEEWMRSNIHSSR